MNTNKKLLVTVSSIPVLITTMSIFAAIHPRFPGDLPVALWLQSFEHKFLSSSMEWISNITDAWFAVLIVCIIIGIVWWRIGWREAVMVLVAEVFLVVSLLMKLIVNRPRPSEELLSVFSVKGTNSFPSGHSFFAILIFGLTAYLVFTYVKNKPLRICLIIILTLFTLLVGVSRVYLGEHWPSDVIGGYLTGGFCVFLIAWFHQKWRGFVE